MTRVLVCRLDSAGDVLLTGPSVRAAASAGEVAMLCGPRGQAAAALLPGVTDIVVFDAPWIALEPSPVDRAAVECLVHSIAARRIDAALISTSFHQSPLPLALLLRLAGVPRVGAVCEDYPGALLDVRHRVDDGIHEVQRNLSLAAAMGWTLPPGDDGVLAVRRDAAAANRVAAIGAAGAVVVHPGAAVPARRWEADRSRAAVRALVAAGHRVVVTGSREERPLTAYVAAGAPHGALDTGGQLSLSELAEVLASASSVVCGNTGPAHLAAAVGTPVVSIFAPTVPAARWRPWRVPHVLLGDQDVACAGCRARTCPLADHACLSGVTPADVVGAVEALAGIGEAVAS